ncbi:ABC transporter substrate-binding protein [Vallitalea pronyensis]|uniref:ABC transporter substrate-binding protein n=1 Tax=Vallitalea pronyensis TaxID=1348613 RepID=A0A8J8MIT6_9FIRM|nr:ABC transporter substrate-binding protein [Vallitalea pronyensis]QUI22419.1 ABC transporter substrate-binding protein [Vallitalea pronyensis]
MKLKGLLSVLCIMILITTGCSVKNKEDVSGDHTPSSKVNENAEDTKEAMDRTENDKPEKPSETEDDQPDEENKHPEGRAKEEDDHSGASKKMPEALTFDTIPERTAVGTVGLTELFDALNIDLVGVPSSRSYSVPKRYADLPTIGMSMQPDMEILKSLDVDMFITDASLQSGLEKSLADKKIKAAFVAASGYDDIMFSITSIGNAFGKMEEAAELIKKMQSKELKVMEKIKDKEKKKVMIIFGTPESFMLATDGAYIGDLAHRLGLENVTDTLEGKSPFLPFSIENVVSMDPDVILRFTHADPETSRKMFEKEFSENPVWNALSAVKQEQVYDLDPHYFGVVANIRCAEALSQLADMIYGE